MNKLICNHEQRYIQSLEQFPKTVKTDEMYTVWPDLIRISGTSNKEFLIEWDKSRNWHYE